MRRSPLLAALLAAAAWTVLTPAMADEPAVNMPPPGGAAGGPSNQNQEVTAISGPRALDPYYLPKGIPISGPFRLYPNLLTEIGYDDNVFRAPDGAKQSSPFLIATPTLILDYDVERLKLDLYGQTSYNEYTQYNLTTWLTGLRGRYEISHDATFEGNLSDGLFFEPYSSANTNSSATVTAKRPNEYEVIDASGKFNYKPNRLGATVGGSYDAYAFTATPSNAVPPPPNENFLRNAQVAKGWLEGSYDFSPGYSAFLRGTYNSDQYSHTAIPTVDLTKPCAVANPCVDRSSHGYSVDAGVTLLLGDLIQGQAFLGYLDQIYHSPFKNISGFDYGANLSWYPTEMLTVHLAGARQIENTTVAGASAGDDKNVALDLDYELLRTLHLLANAGFDDTNYPGATGGRTDKTISFGGGGKFLMSHYVWLSATYTYTNRSSTVSLGRYVDNLAMLGINLQD